MPSALVFRQPSADAAETVRLREYDEPAAPQGTQVLVDFLAAPISPFDLLVVAGRYPSKPQHALDGEHIAGSDGVARVVACGSDITTLRPGDLAVPNVFGLGTWRHRALLEAAALIPIPALADTTFAALFKTCLLPAYLLLEDMRALRPGDWIVQNAGTSVIAQLVTQLAHLRGVRVISIIRDRNSASLRALKHADLVLTESGLPAPELLQGKRIVLALDAVFGASAAQLAACLAPHGTLVNYGQLGGGGPAAEVAVPFKQLFFDQVTVKSFRGTGCIAARSPDELQDLCAWLVGLINQGKLERPDVDVLPWSPDDTGLEARIHRALRQEQDTATVGHKKTVFQIDTTAASGTSGAWTRTRNDPTRPPAPLGGPNSRSLLPYVEKETAPPAVAAGLSRLPFRRNIFHLLAHSPTMYPAVMGLFATFAKRETRTLPVLDWQLIVLRVAATFNVEYEWSVNEPVARAHGMPAAQLAALQDAKGAPIVLGGRGDGVWTTRQRLLLRFVDEQLATYTNEEATVRALLETLSHAEFLEAMYILMFYVMVARLVRAVGIDLDAEIPGLEDMVKMGTS